MTQRKKINVPLNRVEGDLELHVEIEDGVVAEDWSSGVMYRGFENILVGNVPEQVARRADVTVVMVKRRSSPIHDFLRKTVLEPSTGASVKRDNGGRKANGSAEGSR